MTVIVDDVAADRAMTPRAPSAMSPDGAHFADLADDLDRAVGELAALIERDPSIWERARPGHWTGGQHSEHVTRFLALPLAAFDTAHRELRQGLLPAPPRRGPLQALFVATAVRRGWLPRGGKAVPATLPSSAPTWGDVEHRMHDAVGRYRALGSGLDPATLDRLWIRNPFMTLARWRYSLPEMLRVQAVHVRHHAAQIGELASAEQA